jgi:single-stranded DNA-binding protein
MTNDELQILTLKAAQAYRSAMHWHRTLQRATTDAGRADATERVEFWNNKYRSILASVERGDGWIIEGELPRERPKGRRG